MRVEGARLLYVGWGIKKLGIKQDYDGGSGVLGSGGRLKAELLKMHGGLAECGWGCVKSNHY